MLSKYEILREAIGRDITVLASEGNIVIALTGDYHFVLEVGEDLFKVKVKATERIHYFSISHISEIVG